MTTEAEHMTHSEAINSQDYHYESLRHQLSDGTVTIWLLYT